MVLTAAIGILKNLSIGFWFSIFIFIFDTIMNIIIKEPR